MKNSQINSTAIQKIALALGELNERVVFVGGAVLGLYISDPAADDVRPTKDIDISINIATALDLENMRIALIKKGFIQTAEEPIVCRFHFENIAVDVMATKAIGWAPANPWFASGLDTAERFDMEKVTIGILTLPYFFATKFSAYHNRGNNDPRTSHDIEDIVYLMDNRADFVEQIETSAAEVKDYLAAEFLQMVNNDRFQEAIRGNLFYETQTERFAVIMERLHRLTNVV